MSKEKSENAFVTERCWTPLIQAKPQQFYKLKKALTPKSRIRICTKSYGSGTLHLAVQGLCFMKNTHYISTCSEMIPWRPDTLRSVDIVSGTSTVKKARLHKVLVRKSFITDNLYATTNHKAKLFLLVWKVRYGTTKEWNKWYRIEIALTLEVKSSQKFLTETRNWVLEVLIQD